MNAQNKPPISFWIISAAALVWNLLGVFSYLGMQYASEEALAAQYTEEQLKLIEATPAWVTGAFAIAVFAGALGCIALLLRKKWATTIFILSFLGVLAQQVYNFIIAKMHIVMGGTAVFFSVLVLIVAIILIWLSRKWTSNGWLK